ncbi:hypothetical protein [Noviherbaspirillum malthae]|jgi:hypothetical protein|nr:hypothetical protein [Noviherbaspirillum malthae]
MVEVRVENLIDANQSTLNAGTAMEASSSSPAFLIQVKVAATAWQA